MQINPLGAKRLGIIGRPRKADDSTTAGMYPSLLVFSQLAEDLLQKLISLGLSDPASPGIIDDLSKQYNQYKLYPADPPLFPWEVSKEKLVTRATASGCGGCWRGLLLGRHKIALKCGHCTLPTNVVMQVSFILKSLFVFLNYLGTDF